MEKEEMFFAVDNERFLPTDLKGALQKCVDKYNAAQNAELKEIRNAAHRTAAWCDGLYLPYEFGADLSILLFALEGREPRKMA